MLAVSLKENIICDSSILCFLGHFRKTLILFVWLQINEACCLHGSLKISSEEKVMNSTLSIRNSVSIITITDLSDHLMHERQV